MLAPEFALVQLLKNDSTVFGLLGAKIYPQQAPPDTPYPYAVYQVISSVPDRNLVNGNGVATTRVQLDVYYDNYSEIRALSDAVKLALDTKRGLVTVGADSVRLYSVDLSNSYDGFLDPVGGESYGDYRKSMDFLVRHTEQVPDTAI